MTHVLAVVLAWVFVSFFFFFNGNAWSVKLSKLFYSSNTSPHYLGDQQFCERP